MKSSTTFIIRDDGTIVQMYRCAGQSYHIEEKLCNARQERGFRGCSRCTLRRGGKNDPRRKEIDNDTL